MMKPRARRTGNRRMRETRSKRCLRTKPVTVMHTPVFGCSTKWKSKIDSQLEELKKIEAEPVKVTMATARTISTRSPDKSDEQGDPGYLLGHLVRTLSV